MIVENGLGYRHRTGKNPVGGLGKGFAGSGHGEGNGTRKTSMPHHETAVGRGDKEPIVDLRHFAGNLLGENHSDNKTEAPVEPAGECRNGGDQCDGGNGSLGDGGQQTDAPFDDRSGGKCRATYKHQRHLHGEGKQIPHSATPVVDDLERRLMADGHGQSCSNKGEYDGKDKGFGQPTLHQPYTEFNHR